METQVATLTVALLSIPDLNSRHCSEPRRRDEQTSITL